MRLYRLRWVMVAVVATSAAIGCGSKQKNRGPQVIRAPKRNLPPRTPPPQCVHGALVTSNRVCGLGIAGRAMFWDDEKMRGLAQRRAARNLAGMIRTMVTSAMQIQQNIAGSSIRWERYLEIDEDLIDQIEQAAEHEIWFDVKGEGPFRDPERTYDCACMTAAEAGIRIDPRQAREHSTAKVYSIEEVPKWLKRPELHNRSLHCAIGAHENMYHPEEMYEPLTESVRIQLMSETRTWILSEFSQETLCGARSESECQSVIDSVVEAANEGVSRGVVLTAVWLDTRGLGPKKTPKTAYGWGCVFDRVVLDRARDRINALQLNASTR